MAIPVGVGKVGPGSVRLSVEDDGIARGHGATVHLLSGKDGRGLRVEVRFPEAAPA